MADLLLYAAIKSRSDYIDKKTDGEALDFTGNILPSDSGYSSPGGGISDLWKSSLDSFVGSESCSVCIWNSQGYFRCGTNCNWCVPTGVTKLTMEMWGPGGGTSTNCCCGGSPFGVNGSYIALKFDVTPGECLCICAGCAYCCYAFQDENGKEGSPTWFTTDTNLGTTLGCLSACAEGGKGCYQYWNQDAASAGLNAGSNDCMIPSGKSGGTCGPQRCSGWNFCWDSGDDDVEMPPIFSSYTKPNVVCETSAETRNLQVFKIPGVYPCMYIASGSNNSSFTANAPVPRYENCICSFSGVGSTCTGCQMGSPNLYGQGWLCGVPGAGGVGSFVYGGCNACGGDSGRLGLVRLSYTCN